MLALTVEEGLWLAGAGVADVVVGYPSVDRAALAQVARRAAQGDPARQIAVMVDAPEHLELLAGAGGSPGSPVAVCLEADAGLWLAGGRVRVGPRRSPLHTPGRWGRWPRRSPTTRRSGSTG